jgi:wobble nucleotide-excising tRNase
MLDRIQLLQNVGNFDNVAAGARLALQKLALFYAENGKGKTTLAAILRSLGLDDPRIIEDRHRLGSTHQPKVVLIEGTVSYIFENGAWAGGTPNIAVFDDTFVAENVCSGIEIESGHRQNLHELILGAQGGMLNAVLQGHINRVEEHNRALTRLGAAIPVALRGSLSIDEFAALPANPNIDEEIIAAERGLAGAMSAEAVRNRSLFTKISLPDFDVPAITELLQRNLANIQVAAAEKVQAHLTKLGRDGEAWVSNGMDKIQSASAGSDEDVCPFCVQTLSGSEIITDYQAFFSGEYQALKQEIQDFGLALKARHAGELIAAFERAVRLARENSVFWSEFAGIPDFVLDTAAISREWQEVREALLVLLRAKLGAPLEQLTVPPELLARIEAYRARIAEVQVVSDNLMACNARLENVKEQAATANATTLAADVARLHAIRARHTEAATACQEYIDEKAAKQRTEGLRNTARTALDTYKATIFTTYEAAINAYLARFNAGFRIGAVTSVNQRSGTSVTYHVLVNGQVVPLSAERGASFKNVLSAGDRNTLALAFFFASLDQDPQLAQKIVVIDDPMTSLDEHRSLTTVQEVRRLVARVSQVIVLSHSKAFLCSLWRDTERAIQRTAIKIARQGTGSTLEEWDVNQDCITEHDKNHIAVADYITNGGTQNERNVAQALRPILEASIRVAYPIHFPPGSLLGPFHAKCVQGLATGITILSEPDAAELRALLDYANNFHHETNAAWETIAINDTELTDFCTRTIRFTQRA